MAGAWLGTGAILALACWLGTGCETVRRARDAQSAAGIPAGERTLRAAEVGVTSNTVLTLEAALQIASAYHPSVARARESLASAVAQVRETKAAYWPSVDASAGYSRSTANTESSRGSNHAGDSYSAGLSLNLLVYDFGKTPAAVRQAYLGQLSAEASLLSARNDVAFGVRAAFLDLCRAQELVNVAEEAVRQYRVHLDQVKTFAEVGRRIRYDVTKAEVDLGNAQLELISARNGVASARAALNRTLGLAEEPGYRIAQPHLAEIEGAVDDLMAVARRHHPDLLALEAQAMAASAAVDQAIADLYPSLSLQAGYQLGGSKLPLVWNWSGALQSALGIFSGWGKTAKIDDSVAQLRSARAAFADREQQVYLVLTLALNTLDSARQRLALTELIVQQAQESLDLVSERYRLGQASAVEVTDAQVALTSAQSDQVKARFDHQTALATIMHAMGEE